MTKVSNTADITQVTSTVTTNAHKKCISPSHNFHTLVRSLTFFIQSGAMLTHPKLQYVKAGGIYVVTTGLLNGG
jgi:hypothetical protein